MDDTLKAEARTELLNLAREWREQAEPLRFIFHGSDMWNRHILTLMASWIEHDPDAIIDQFLH